MHKERKFNALKEVLGDYSAFRKGDEAVFFCPKHPHTKRKLSVNLTTDAFHCWICHFGHKSSILPLLELNGETVVSKEYKDERVQKEVIVEKKYDEVVLPKEFRPLSEPRSTPYYKQAMAYLAKRNVSADDILMYRLGYAEDGEYSGRIIIPSFDNHGELNFFVGRAIFDHPLKYKHGNFSKDIIFNEYMIDWSKPVRLVEGPFDAIASGPDSNTIALQGSQLQEGSYLFHNLLDRKPQVFVILDSDAWKQSVRVMDRLLSFGIDVRYVDLLSNKDPGELGSSELKKYVDKSVDVSEKLDLLKMRLARLEF